MLAFQRNWNHIEEGCQRANIEPTWLLEVVSEINLYLPEDWRMTRSSNNFRIQIISQGAPALVGRSFRGGGDEILHIIDTVFLKGFFDQYDLHSEVPEKVRINQKLKSSFPEILIPNLYYYRPCPEDFTSPLFARQYEKVKIGEKGEQKGDQFHRLHPLKKEGVDLAHFHWVRWTTNGDVQRCEYPEAGYHGKDYWIIPSLSSNAQRGRMHDYIKGLENLLNEFRIGKPELPQTTFIFYETEFKFTVFGTEKDANAAFDLFDETIAPVGFKIRDFSNRSQIQEDMYFDDSQFSLYNNGCSFRFRKRKGSLRVTLKKRFCSKQETTDIGLYERIEEEATITPKQRESLFVGDAINVLPYRLIAYVAPHCLKIKPVLKVINERRTHIIEDIYHRKVEICLDRFTYQIEGQSFGPFYEVEIESKGAHKEDISKLSAELMGSLGLIASPESKYERGVSLLRKTF